MKRWVGVLVLWGSVSMLCGANPMVDRMGTLSFRLGWSAITPPATHVQIRGGTLWVAHQGQGNTPAGIMVLDGLTGKVARQHPIGMVGTWAQSPGLWWVSGVGKGVSVWPLREPLTTRWQLPTMIPVQMALDDLDSDGIDDAVCRDASGRLMAIGGRSGTPLWRYPRRIASVSMVVDEMSSDGVRDVVVVVGSRLVALDGRTGKEHWGVTLNAPAQQLVGLPDDMVVLDANQACQWVGRDGVLGVRVSTGEKGGDQGMGHRRLTPLADDRVLVMGDTGGWVVTKTGRVLPIKSTGGTAGPVGSWRSDALAWVVTGNQLGAINRMGEWVVSTTLPEALRLPPLLGDVNANGRMDMVLVGVSGRIRVYEIRGVDVDWNPPFGNPKNTMVWHDTLDAYPPHFIPPNGTGTGNANGRISDGMGPVRLMTTLGRLRRALSASYRLVPPTKQDRRWTLWQDGTLHLSLSVTMPPGGTADQSTVRRIDTQHPGYQLEGISVGSTLSDIRARDAQLGEWQWDAAGNSGRVSHYPWVTLMMNGQTVAGIWVE